MASSRSKVYGVLALLLLAGAVLFGFMMARGGGDVESVGQAESTLTAREAVPEELGVARGAEDAPVLIEEYADYQCPYCAMVATLTLPQVFENYVETGKVRFVFYDFPLHPGLSQLGAEAARCAGDQDAFWPMQKLLFERQREWGEKRDAKGTLQDYAEQLGLNGEAFDECLDSRKYRDVVLASQQRARQLGLNSTPTFFINGRLLTGAVGYDRMAALIDEELAKH